MQTTIRYGVIISFSVGVLFVVAGYFIPETKLVSILFTSIGGAIVGAAISAGVGYILTRDIENDIKQIVREGYENSLDLDENIVSKHRKTYYLYHVTSIDGKFVWRCAVLDFCQATAFGKLVTSAIATKDGLSYNYYYKGHIKMNGGRLVLCSTRDNEPPGIYVFPEFGDDLQQYSSGIASIHTWDGYNSMSQCVISVSALNDGDEKQSKNTVVTINEKHFENMNSKWKSALRQKHYHVLPLIHDKENTFKVPM